MNEQDFYPESSRSLDSLREMRLKALLRDMIDAEDGAKAAQALGVSYRTVSRAVESGSLTARMSAALERHLLLGRATPKPPPSGSSRIGSMRHVERRLVRLEAGRSESETPSPTGSGD